MTTEELQAIRARNEPYRNQPLTPEECRRFTLQAQADVEALLGELDRTQRFCQMVGQRCRGYHGDGVHCPLCDGTELVLKPHRPDSSAMPGG